MSELLENDWIDFALLPPRHQTQIITRVKQDAGAREQLVERTPVLGAAAALWSATSRSEASSDALIRQNADVVRQAYSAQASGQRLVQLYDRVMSESPGEDAQRSVDNDQILEAFLNISPDVMIHSERTGKVSFLFQTGAVFPVLILSIRRRDSRMV